MMTSCPQDGHTHHGRRHIENCLLLRLRPQVVTTVSASLVARTVPLHSVVKIGFVVLLCRRVRARAGDAGVLRGVQPPGGWQRLPVRGRDPHPLHGPGANATRTLWDMFLEHLLRALSWLADKDDFCWRKPHVWWWNQGGACPTWPCGMHDCKPTFFLQWCCLCPENAHGAEIAAGAAFCGLAGSSHPVGCRQ